MFRIVGLAVLLAVSVYSTSFQDVGIAEHNRLRAKHGGPNVTLDSGLQGLAQQWVDYLASIYKFERSRIGYGQNIFLEISSSASINITKSVKTAITSWYGTIQYYNFSNPRTEVYQYQANDFTQLVWKASTKVGIGAAVFQDPITRYTNVIVVAYYNPPGNVISSDGSTYKTNVVPPK